MTAGRVFIALPAFGRINSTETTMSLMAVARALHENGIEYYFSSQSFPDIAELRNMMLTLWYDRLLDAEYMLMIDADMGFEAPLVLDMLALGAPLVGCIYPKKTNPLGYVGRPLPGPMIPHNGFLEMEGVGAGVLLVRRDCIAAMLKAVAAKSDERLATHAAGPLLKEWGAARIIRAFDPIETETGELSEDLSFCRRHRLCGGKVWAAVNHRITHVGPYSFSGRFADQLPTSNAHDAPQVRG